MKIDDSLPSEDVDDDDDDADDVVNAEEEAGMTSGPISMITCDGDRSRSTPSDA